MPDKEEFTINTCLTICNVPINQIVYVNNTFYLITDVNGKEEIAYIVDNSCLDYNSGILTYKQNQQDIGRMVEYVINLINTNKTFELVENNTDFSISKT